MVFCLGEDALRSYDDGAKLLQLHDADVELENNICKIQCKQLSCKLDDLQDTVGTNVGHLQMESSFNSQVLYLLLSSTTDPQCQIRRTLANTIYEWCSNVDLRCAKGTEDNEYLTNQEVTILKEKLGRAAPSARVFSYPCDGFLRVNKPNSVCCRLFRHYTKHLNKQPASKSLVVFVGPVDTNVVVYGLYVKRCLESVLRENLCQSNMVFFVLDVGAALHVTKLAHILPDMDDTVHVNAWTALDPTKDVISCVILKFTCTN